MFFHMRRLLNIAFPNAQRTRALRGERYRKERARNLRAWKRKEARRV